MRAARLALLSVCLAAPGCSLFLLNNRRGQRCRRPARTRGARRALPWADTVLATLSAIGVAAASTIDCQGSGCEVKAAIVMAPGALMIGYGFSALWGHSTVSRCRWGLKE